MMTAWLVALTIAIQTLPSPAPALTPPPTIIRERVSPVCSTLHQLVVPLARLQAEYGRANVQINKYQQQLAKYNNTKLQDGVFFYSAKIDQQATNMLGRIHEIELLLIKSYHQYPQGTNPKVDALRQRVQNVVDIERATANRFAANFGAVVDAAGLDTMASSTNGFGVGGARATPTPWPEITSLPTSSPVDTLAGFQADNDPLIESAPPPGVSARELKYYRMPALTSALEREGHALVTQSLIAARDCDGA